MNPGHRISTSLLSRLSSDLASGATSLQNQIDQLTLSFIDQATDGKNLAAMVAGELAYPLGKIGVSTLGVGRISALPLRVMSVGMGLGTEVTAFEFTNRVLNSFREWTGSKPTPTAPLWKWEGPAGWKEGFLSSAATFGLLKGTGHLAREQNLICQHLILNTAMVMGYRALGTFEGFPKPEGSLAEQFFHAETANLQIQTGLRSAQGLIPNLIAFERSLDLLLTSQKEVFSPKNRLNFNPPFPQFENASPALRKGQPGGFEIQETRERPLPLQMSSGKKMEGGIASRGDFREIYWEALKENQEALTTFFKYAEAGDQEAVDVIATVAHSNEEARQFLKNFNISLFVQRDPIDYSALEKLAFFDNQSASTLLIDRSKKGDKNALYALLHIASRPGGSDQIKSVLGHLDLASYLGQVPQDTFILVMFSLFELGNETSTDALEKLDPSSFLKRSSQGDYDYTPLRMLAHAGNPMAIDFLASRAGKDDVALRTLFVTHKIYKQKEALRRLKTLDISAYSKKVDRFDMEALERLIELAEIGNENALEKIIELERNIIAVYAFYRLAKGGNKRALETLLGSVYDPALRDTWTSLVRDLAMNGHPEAEKALKSGMRSPQLM
jgi:hypothetical protein